MASYRAGLDIGSTTVKFVIFDEDQILHKSYERHGSDVGLTLQRLITEARQIYGDIAVSVNMTGSGALSLSEVLGIKFIQEVDASEIAVRHFAPEVDTVIELGGEDAKAIFIEKDRTDHEMNDSCAGGTGAFIDQMATLLDTDAGGLNEYAKTAEKSLSIASRCGVFAKSDIQPLINDGEKTSNIARGIFDAVARQVVGNLVKGKLSRCRNIILLGGPLKFLSELREAFKKRIPKANFTCPENAEYYVAFGAAFASSGEESINLDQILVRLVNSPELKVSLPRLDALFSNEAEYDAFKLSHKTGIEQSAIVPGENLYLGIDAGSTTFKAVLINDQKQIVWSYYDSNRGKLGERIEQLTEKVSALNIAHSVAVGYGEDRIIKSGLANSGEVETVAHLTAAKFLQPEVDFILDIGGQDMKAIWIRDDSIEKIQLNEACSSGCGSFIETYVKSLGLTLDQFNDLACASKAPVLLGTRCTVFMNSSIKQAQKEGIPLPDIAAGLACSVVNNALYKVIRINSMAGLGKHIVVQGGTFLNDSVLRAFELEIGAEVTRPEIAGLMGAFGAALLAYDRAKTPALIPEPIQASKDLPNIPALKLKLLTDRNSEDYWPVGQIWPANIIGIPLALNMFENYPFWHAFFSSLGFKVVPSRISDQNTYKKGIDTIFSGMACYPAKLLHGHIVDLVEQHVKYIWMPFIKWERAETKQRNQYNCPVVMGYPEAVKNNMSILGQNDVIMFTDPLPYDKPKALLKRLSRLTLLASHTDAKIKKAFENALNEDAVFKKAIQIAGQSALKYLDQHNIHGIVLAGHPYHVDPEVHHGIPAMLNSLGVAVLTEDSIAHLSKPGQLRVSNQWTYHGRLYRAARIVATRQNLDLVQLISFGCGIDAVTGDQVQEIIEASGKIYTQLKIDEMSNTKPARIRARSLLYAIRKRSLSKAASS